MNILDIRFRYLSSATHSTPEAFRDRQRARMHRAAAERNRLGELPPVNWPEPAPYPQHCIHPQKCAGLSNCPRDPVCID